MTPSSPKPSRESQSRPAEPPAGPKQPSPPWRTEGLPPGQPPKRRPRWLSMVLWGAASLVLFTTLTMQERAVGAGCRAVHGVQAPGRRQERRRGVRARRLDRRRAEEGRAAPRPRRTGAYQQFTTERPTFAKDDLLAELTASGATVRATPLVQQRGFLTNLLMSFAPMLLLFVFWSWMLRRQQGAMGGILGGGKQRRVDPETVRVTFEDVAGIDEVEAEINEVVDFLQGPGEVPAAGRARAQGRAARRARPAPARRCSRAPPPARPRCRSSAPAPPSSSR